VHAGDDLDLQGGQRHASGHRPAIMRPPPRGVQQRAVTGYSLSKTRL
jgi:hypothetical protein